MDDEKSAFTGAQAQIERLKKLKEQKDLADKAKKDEEFRFAELPHAITNSTKQNDSTLVAESEKIKMNTVGEKPVKNIEQKIKKTKNKKLQRVSRLDRKNFERIVKIVKKIKGSGSSTRLSNDMFVNMILEKIFELKIDFSQARTATDIKAIINKIKVE